MFRVLDEFGEYARKVIHISSLISIENVLRRFDARARPIPEFALGVFRLNVKVEQEIGVILELLWTESVWFALR